MVNSITVVATRSLLVTNFSALSLVNFDCSLINFDFYSHGQAVSTYNKLNMSKNSECAEPFGLGCRTWLI